MAGKQRPRYPQEVQERAVRLSMEAGKTVGEVASELGISTSSLTGRRQKMGVFRGRTGEHKLRSEPDTLSEPAQTGEEKKALEDEIVKKLRPSSRGTKRSICSPGTRRNIWLRSRGGGQFPNRRAV